MTLPFCDNPFAKPHINTKHMNTEYDIFTFLEYGLKLLPECKRRREANIASKPLKVPGLISPDETKMSLLRYTYQIRANFVTDIARFLASGFDPAIHRCRVSCREISSVG